MLLTVDVGNTNITLGLFKEALRSPVDVINIAVRQ